MGGVVVVVVVVTVVVVAVCMSGAGRGGAGTEGRRGEERRGEGTVRPRCDRVLCRGDCEECHVYCTVEATGDERATQPGLDARCVTTDDAERSWTARVVPVPVRRWCWWKIGYEYTDDSQYMVCAATANRGIFQQVVRILHGSWTASLTL